MRRNDPRIRQTLNQISHNLESANLTTQASLFSFSQSYISPCFSSLNTCLEASCQPCFGASKRDDRRTQHRQRQQQRGRESLAFDFYDDWEQDEAEWGNDELDRLLSSDGDLRAQQPSKQGGMNYGSRVNTRKKVGEDDDVNVLPKSSMFGFLERLPWKIGGRGVRYRPSIADLQENVGRRGVETEPLISEEESDDGNRRHGRSRSGTVGSRSTTNSLSSRGDLFPSEDEDDAVPLDDEFAIVLERRTTTGTTGDDHSSKKKGKRRPSVSRASTKTGSTKSSNKARRGTSASSGNKAPRADSMEENVPSMVDLKQEEERVRREEEVHLKEKRQAAQRLALECGLGGAEEDPAVRSSAISTEFPGLT